MISSSLPTFQLEVGSLADWVAGIGSLIAVIVAMLGYWVVARHRNADRRDAERAVAFELVAVLMEIANHILSIEKHFKTQRNDMTVSADGKHVVSFKIINPLIGLSSEGEIRPPEGTTQLLIRANAIELWNDVLLLANHNRALTSIMKEYRHLWDQTMAKMPTPADFTGPVGHIEAEGPAFAAIRPDLIKLDSIVEGLEPQISEAVALTKKVAGEIGPALQEYFGESFLHLADGPALKPEKKAAAGPNAHG